jgi:hypothetical protein
LRLVNSRHFVLAEKAFDKAFQLEDGGFKGVDGLDFHHHLPPHHFTHSNAPTTTTAPINSHQQSAANAGTNENGRHKKNSLGKSGSLGGSEGLSLPSVLGASLKTGMNWT